MKICWENELEVPEEISKGSIWGIAFVVAVFFSIFCAMIQSLGFIENPNFLLIFFSTFFLVGALGSYIRLKSMNERKQRER